MIFRGLFLMFVGGSALAAKPPPPPPPADPGGAVEAIRALPAEYAAHVARIEAPEGKPLPDRWYVLVYEPTAPRGLREFAVDQSHIAAARPLSQFADKLTEDQTFTEAYVRADANYCARIALLYAAANGLNSNRLHFELARPANALPPDPEKPEPSLPVWRVAVVNQRGDELGAVSISAVRGTVVGHERLDREPDPALLPSPPPDPPASLVAPKIPPKTKEKAPASGKKKKGR